MGHCNYLTKAFLSILIIVFLLSNGRAQDKDCGSERCIGLRECPVMLVHATSRVFFRKMIFRRAICSNRPIKVCCPGTRSQPTTPSPGVGVFFPGGGGGVRTNPPRPTDPPKPPSGEGLLPSKCGRPSIADRIIGGRPAPIGAYPWVAALGYEEIGFEGVNFDCSGTLYTDRHVITAAHCLFPEDLAGRNLKLIHLGDWDLSSERDCQARDTGMKCNAPHIVARPKEIIIHEDYKKTSESANDIGIVKLDTIINFNSLSTAPVHPICLPSEGLNCVQFAQGRRGIAMGWGITERHRNSDILLRVLLPFADVKRCSDFYGNRFDKNQLCIGGVPGLDTCNGDSGGGFVLSGDRGPPFYLCGIVSYGVSPCGLDTPGVYTEVEPYLPWIKRKTTA